MLSHQSCGQSPVPINLRVGQRWKTFDSPNSASNYQCQIYLKKAILKHPKKPKWIRLPEISAMDIPGLPQATIMFRSGNFSACPEACQIAWCFAFRPSLDTPQLLWISAVCLTGMAGMGTVHDHVMPGKVVIKLWILLGIMLG